MQCYKTVELIICVAVWEKLRKMQNLLLRKLTNNLLRVLSSVIPVVRLKSEIRLFRHFPKLQNIQRSLEQPQTASFFQFQAFLPKSVGNTGTYPGSRVHKTALTSPFVTVTVLRGMGLSMPATRERGTFRFLTQFNMNVGYMGVSLTQD